MIFFLFKCGNNTHTKTKQNFELCGDNVYGASYHFFQSYNTLHTYISIYTRVVVTTLCKVLFGLGVCVISTFEQKKNHSRLELFVVHFEKKER